MDSTAFFTPSPFPPGPHRRRFDGTSRTSNEKENETLRVSTRGSPTNYLLRYDLPRLCSLLGLLSAPNRLRGPGPFKLPREIKLLRVSSRYYTHAPPIEIHSYTIHHPPSSSIILSEYAAPTILRNRCGFARLMRLERTARPIISCRERDSSFQRPRPQADLFPLF